MGSLPRSYYHSQSLMVLGTVGMSKENMTGKLVILLGGLLDPIYHRSVLFGIDGAQTKRVDDPYMGGFSLRNPPRLC